MLLVEVVKALGGLFKLVTLTSKTVRSSKLTRIDPTHLINGPYSNCWLSRTGTVSETYGDFSRKCEFSTALSAPAKGVPLGTGAWGQKNRNDGATGPKKKFDNTFSRLATIPERDKLSQTDRRTDDSKDRAYA